MAVVSLSLLVDISGRCWWVFVRSLMVLADGGCSLMWLLLVVASGRLWWLSVVTVGGY